MTWILIMTALLLAVFIYFVRRDFSNPAFVFEAEWTVILILYALRLYDYNYYELSDRAFWILFIQLVFFPVGYFVFCKMRLVVGGNRSQHELKESAQSVLKKNIFFVLCAISAITLLLNDIIVIQNLLSGNTFYMMAREGIATQEATGIRVYLMIFLVYPTIALVSPVCAAEFASDSKKNKIYLLVNVIIVALASLDHGGRVYLINMVVSYVFAYIIFGKKVHLSHKQKRFLLILVVALIAITVILSSSRGIDNLWKSIYLYLTCSVPHLVSRLEQPLFRESITYGVLSLRGFIYPVYLLLHFVGLITQEPHILTVVENISKAIEQDAFIGTNVSTNAFLPMAYYFYIDFRMIGTILCVMLYGGIVGKHYNKARATLSKRNVAIFLMLMYGLFSSYIRFPFKAYQYAVGFIYLLFIYRLDFTETERNI